MSQSRSVLSYVASIDFCTGKTSSQGINALMADYMWTDLFGER